MTPIEIRDQICSWDDCIPTAYKFPPGVSQWCGDDSEVNHNRRIADGKNTFGYSAESLSYSFNKYGYRDKEFDLATTATKILVCGCSHTVGIGIRVEDRWSSRLHCMVSEYGEVEIYNTAMSGASTDYVCRTIVQSINVVRPEIVLVLWPSGPRRELVFDRAPFNAAAGVWNANEYYIDVSRANLAYQFRKNQKFVQTVCALAGTPLVEYAVDDATREFAHVMMRPDYVPARDLSHGGPLIHQALAEHFFNLLERNNALDIIANRRLASVQ